MSGLPGSDRDSLYNPNPGRYYNYNITRGPKESAGNIKTSSIYALDTIDLNEQFSVNLGLRYDSFKVDDTEDSRKDNFLNYQLGRSEERRVGKKCVSTLRFRGWP